MRLNKRHEISGEVSSKGTVPCGRGYPPIEKRPYAVVPSLTSIFLRLLLLVLQGFLVYFENELLKRAHKNFDFRNGRSVYLSGVHFSQYLFYVLHISVGNYFLAAAQGFFRSLPSAIFLFSAITNSQANILPVIVTNHTVTIAAALVCISSHLFSPFSSWISYRKMVKKLLANARYPIQWRNQKLPFSALMKYQHLL